ncbi:MAG: NAD+ synthase [Gemmatimonadaceae bacterium]|nr:NAD+ synthase [Gemmatimonadaceae bacterium]
MIHLASLQFAPRKGEYVANLRRLTDFFAQIDTLAPRPHVLHLPETALTGYFVEGGVRELALTAGALARDLQQAYLAVVPAERTLEVVLGFYEVWQNTLYNSAMCVRLGGEEPLIRHVHRKNFLPTYGLFDEERFVERGHEVRAFDMPWGRCAILVCEDAWHSLPGTLLALDGAQIIFLSAAAPARGAWPRDDGIPGPASVARWERLARDIAEEHGVFVSLTNLATNEGGKSFPGGSLIVGPDGVVRARATLWDETILAVPADLADITRARADTPLLADLRTAMPHLLETLDRIRAEVPAELSYDPAPPAPCTESREAARTDGAPSERAAGDGRARLPVIAVSAAEAGGPPPLEIDAALTERWLTQFLADETRQRGFRNGIVAISGGVDSAVTAFLAARALGPEHVIGVRLPYRTSSPESLEHAQLVIDALGIEARTIEITAAVDGYLAHEPDADATRRGNVMARMRMIALFDLSARYRAIPLGTGNKTERLLGYFTWHADDSPPLNPLGDLYKTQVWALARHLGVPKAIIEKAPTADLVTGQTDEGDIGISYAKADRILHWLLHGFSVDDLAARGFPREEVELVRQRLERTHWKRRPPTVAMLSATAIGESYLRPVDY